MSQDFNVSCHVITFLQEPEHIGLNPNTPTQSSHEDEIHVTVSHSPVLQSVYTGL